MAGTFLDNLTVDDVAAMFSPADRKRIKENWPLVAASLKRWHLTDRDIVLYVIATIDAETYPKFSPAAEQANKYSRKTDKAGYAGIQDPGTVRPFGAYDSTIRFDKGKPVINKNLGNAYYRGKDDALMRARHGDPEIPDLNEGEKFRGRGFVQMTGRYNYGQMQRAVGGPLGIDLLEHPEVAEDPAVAAEIIACFISKRRQTTEQHLTAGEYKKARRVVNNLALHWEAIERVRDAYATIEAKRAAKGAASKTPAPRTPTVISSPP
jgi:hypothetical protein